MRTAPLTKEVEVVMVRSADPMNALQGRRFSLVVPVKSVEISWQCLITNNSVLIHHVNLQPNSQLMVDAKIAQSTPSDKETEDSVVLTYVIKHKDSRKMVLVKNALITKRLKVTESNVPLTDAPCSSSWSLLEPVRHALNIRNRVSMGPRRLP